MAMRALSSLVGRFALSGAAAMPAASVSAPHTSLIARCLTASTPGAGPADETNSVAVGSVSPEDILARSRPTLVNGR